MPKSKIRKKFYMVTRNKKNLGVFPFTEEGNKEARKYAKSLEKAGKSGKKDITVEEG